jgi:hypothetical protein
VKSYSFDTEPDDFDLSHFDHNLTYEKVHVMPLVQAAIATAKVVTFKADTHRILISCDPIAVAWCRLEAVCQPMEPTGVDEGTLH